LALDGQAPLAYDFSAQFKAERVALGPELEDFYSFSSIMKRSRGFGYKGWKAHLAYYALNRGLFTRYRRHGLSQDSAVLVLGMPQRSTVADSPATKQLITQPRLSPQEMETLRQNPGILDRLPGFLSNSPILKLPRTPPRR